MKNPGEAKNNYQMRVSSHSADNRQSESESASFIDGNIKKTPVKYRYLTVQQSDERQRQLNIFWLQCLAVFIFIYSSTCSKLNTGVDLSFFVGAMIAIPVCAMQTGANLNPAVSLAMTFKANHNPFQYQSLLWIYIKAQVIGAVLSMIVALNLNGVYVDPVFPVFVSEETGSNYFQFSVILQIIMSEAIGVFILVFVIITATGPYSYITSKGVKFVYISVFIYIGRKFAAVSGNQINLALTISQAFVGMIQCDFRGLQYLLVWIIGDLLGVFLATSFYNQVVEPLLGYLQEHKTEKEMLKTEAQRQIEIRQSQLKNRENKRRIEQKRESKNSGSERGQQYKNYYAKLQYF